MRNTIDASRLDLTETIVSIRRVVEPTCMLSMTEPRMISIG